MKAKVLLGFSGIMFKVCGGYFRELSARNADYTFNQPAKACKIRNPFNMKGKKEFAGKIKLYADENIRRGIVRVLRNLGVNIKHASEEGLLRKDDQTHFQYAKKTDRWLLTTDRHFLNHTLFPYEQIKGIVIVPDTGEDLVAGRIIAWLKKELVPSGKGIDNCKVEFRKDGVVFHFRKEGKIYTQKLDA